MIPLGDVTPPMAHTERANWLGLVVHLFSPEPGVAPEEIAELGIEACSLGERGAARESPSARDFDLANACLALEAERRRRQWAALERLLPHLVIRDGALEWPGERSGLVSAVRSALEVGWFGPAPSEVA